MNKDKDKVVIMNVITTLEISPSRVLKGAIEEGLESVIVIGVTKDGEEYFASSIADGANALWWMERARHKLLSVPDRDN